MKNEDVEIGMKVVPFQKTKIEFDTFETSSVLRWAKQKNQPYLYVTKYSNRHSCWFLSDRKDGSGNDYFNACDFIPYVEPVQEFKPIRIPVIVNQSDNGGYIVKRGHLDVYTYDNIEEVLEKIKFIYTQPK